MIWDAVSPGKSVRLRNARAKSCMEMLLLTKRAAFLSNGTRKDLNEVAQGPLLCKVSRDGDVINNRCEVNAAFFYNRF